MWSLSLGSCFCLDLRSCLCSLESQLGASRVCLDCNLNWFVHLLFPSFSSSLTAAVCHLNNKCRWFPDLVRGSGLWCILILTHKGPSLIWIKEVEFENSQCFTWIQIASIYCSELWNSHQLCPSPPCRSSASHKSKKRIHPWPFRSHSTQHAGALSLKVFIIKTHFYGGQMNSISLKTIVVKIFVLTETPQCFYGCPSPVLDGNIPLSSVLSSPGFWV